jgi:hypothetical protein
MIRGKGKASFGIKMGMCLLGFGPMTKRADMARLQGGVVRVI